MKNLVFCIQFLCGFSPLLLHAQEIHVCLKALLEGPFMQSEMSTTLNSGGYLPLSQPFSGQPWAYPGNETVTSIPNPDIVDWILVELRETAGDASTAYQEKVIGRRAGFLLQNGLITDINGSGPLHFPVSPSQNLFARVYHRNHIPVLSGYELVYTSGMYTYDFTTGAGQAYGADLAQKEIVPGIWGQVAGDCNSDGQVTTQDKVDVWIPQAGMSGYQKADCDLDGEVTNRDKIEFISANAGRGTQDPGSWSCNKPVADDRDGQIYGTVLIGTQCWMVENLNVGVMIPGASDPANNSLIEKYCYNDIIDSCAIYGGLYQWDEMMQYATTAGTRGICPENWHLPTDAEWCLLEQTVDPTISCNSTGYRGIDGGGRLKETGFEHWLYPNEGAANTSGFTALPAGYRYINGVFDLINRSANFWTSSEYNSSASWFRYLHFLTDQVGRDTNPKANGFSVRCVKPANDPPLMPSDPNPPDQSTGQIVTSKISWTCSDPENDPMTFDVFFGTSELPVLVSSGQAEYSYDPGTLDYNTNYFWRIVARDDHNHMTEGDTWTFRTGAWTCGDSITDTRDGKKYGTVLIGTQCWMSQNLNTGNMVPGASTQLDNGQIEKYCYNDIPSSCDIFGGLYQWNEMMQYVTVPGVKGICPLEWHLPTDQEWCTLETFLDNSISCILSGWRGTDGGGKLKEEGTGHWSVPNTGATNSSGFTALPGGYCNYGLFYGLHEYAYFSSSSEYSFGAWNRGMSFESAALNRDSYNKNDGYSVRCIMNQNQPPEFPSSPQPADQSINIGIEVDLSWVCIDPDNDPLIYDVYFGDSNPPELVSSGQTGNTYDPGTLSLNTNYYWKIVAFDDHNHSAAGQVWSFTTIAQPQWQCGDPMVDIRDSKQYATVLIGTQCWMAQNMNIGTLVSGTVTMSNNSIFEKYCYNNSEDNCDIYGGLYQWNEMMQYVNTPGAQGICVTGWHVPTDAEWCVLEQFVDPAITCSSTGARGTTGGGKLKESGIAHWSLPNYGGTNESGFTGLPGGYRGIYGGFYSLNTWAYFSTSSEYGTSAWNRGLTYNNASIYRANYNKTDGYSVRCLKN